MVLWVSPLTLIVTASSAGVSHDFLCMLLKLTIVMLLGMLTLRLCNVCNVLKVTVLAT